MVTKWVILDDDEPESEYICWFLLACRSGKLLLYLA
jgi:hypothetical protein